MLSKRSALLGLVAAAASAVLLADPATAQSVPASGQMQAAARAPSSGTSFGLAGKPDPEMIVMRGHRRHHRRRHHRRHRFRHFRHHRYHYRHHRRHYSHHMNSSRNTNTNTNTNTNVNINKNVNIVN